MVQDMGKLAISFALVARSAFAATADEDAIQSTFVKPWIEAARSGDKARIEQFLHPRVRACINASTKEYFDFGLDNDARGVAAGPYLVTKLAPLKGPPPAFLPEDGFPYPVQPTYEVQIEFEKSNLLSIHLLAPANGSWFEVFPCPNEKGMASMRQHLVEGAEQKKRAAQLLADLKDPLRSELTDLLRREQKMDAVKKYQAAAGVDLTTAVMVINALQQSDR
jgi:hypothetical protein